MIGLFGLSFGRKRKLCLSGSYFLSFPFVLVRSIKYSEFGESEWRRIFGVEEYIFIGLFVLKNRLISHVMSLFDLVWQERDGLRKLYWSEKIFTRWSEKKIQENTRWSQENTRWSEKKIQENTRWSQENTRWSENVVLE